MITRTYTITDDNFTKNGINALNITQLDRRLECGMFFDIETTGFFAERNALYLIGVCCYEQGQWRLTQWMAQDESPEEQRLILEHFLDAIAKVPTIISYNGQTFDLPFIAKKCAALHLSADFSFWEHWDLYKEIRKVGSFLGLKNLKLKTVERFLGIYREDQYSGGDLIPIYKSYTGNHSHALEELLLLHNYEDIKDMLFILPILSYRQLFCGPWKISDPRLNTDKKSGARKPELSFTIAFDHPLPKTLGEKNFFIDTKGSIFSSNALPQNQPAAILPQFAPFSLHITAKTMTLTLPFISGELKYFYDNYRDYYYLPEEDCAVHKSVAAFVDKSYRKKATAKNCYTKKAGYFLPQPEQIFTPAFKYEYNDKLSWFDPENAEFSETNIVSYIQCFLRFLNFGSF